MIFVGGLQASMEEEGTDRVHNMGFPGVQLDLIKALQAVGKPLVVVTVSGGPVAEPFLADPVSHTIAARYAVHTVTSNLCGGAFVHWFQVIYTTAVLVMMADTVCGRWTDCRRQRHTRHGYGSPTLDRMARASQKSSSVSIPHLGGPRSASP